MWNYVTELCLHPAGWCLFTWGVSDWRLKNSWQMCWRRRNTEMWVLTRYLLGVDKTRYLILKTKWKSISFYLTEVKCFWKEKWFILGISEILQFWVKRNFARVNFEWTIQILSLFHSLFPSSRLSLFSSHLSPPFNFFPSFLPSNSSSNHSIVFLFSTYQASPSLIAFAKYWKIAAKTIKVQITSNGTNVELHKSQHYFRNNGRRKKT